MQVLEFVLGGKVASGLFNSINPILKMRNYSRFSAISLLDGRRAIDTIEEDISGRDVLREAFRLPLSYPFKMQSD
jgi:hypothetical protein